MTDNITSIFTGEFYTDFHYAMPMVAFLALIVLLIIIGYLIGRKLKEYKTSRSKEK